jgi:hypothetical protein
MWGRLIDRYTNPKWMSPGTTRGCRSWPPPRASGCRAVGIAVCTVIMAVCARSGATEPVMRDHYLDASALPNDLHCILSGPTVGIGFSYRPFTAPRRLE